MKINLYNSDLTFEIDDEDYEKVSKYNWTLRYFNGKPAAIQTSPTKTITIVLARMLMGCIKDNGMDVDHRDRNIFNNKKSNLRWATLSENCVNKGRYSNNTSGYKGVCWKKGSDKWCAYIRFENKRYHLGYFECKILAAIAYDNAAIDLHGEFAALNFPLYGA